MQAIWRAVTTPHAGDWLLAKPIASCGLKLDDETVRVSVGLRLGTNLCEAHTYVCGQRVTAQGHNGLSCIRGFGRQARHGVINDVIYRALTKAGYPTVKEPPGLVRSDGKRPDGLTLIPWRASPSLVWDAMVTDTLTASYLANTSTTAGATAEAVATRKQAKYQELSNTHVFIPLALETLGPINNTGMDFISDLARDLTRSTGDPREASFIFQRLSICVQRFNAVAFRGTFTDSGNRDYNTMTIV